MKFGLLDALTGNTVASSWVRALSSRGKDSGGDKGGMGTDKTEESVGNKVGTGTGIVERWPKDGW
jgi:hypothetical protein